MSNNLKPTHSITKVVDTLIPTITKNKTNLPMTPRNYNILQISRRTYWTMTVFPVPRTPAFPSWIATSTMVVSNPPPTCSPSRTAPRATSRPLPILTSDSKRPRRNLTLTLTIASSTRIQTRSKRMDQILIRV